MEAAALVHDLTRAEPPPDLNTPNAPPDDSGGDLPRPGGKLEPPAPDDAPQERPESNAEAAAPLTDMGTAYEDVLRRSIPSDASHDVDTPDIGATRRSARRTGFGLKIQGGKLLSIDMDNPKRDPEELLPHEDKSRDYRAMRGKRYGGPRVLFIQFVPNVGTHKRRLPLSSLRLMDLANDGSEIILEFSDQTVVVTGRKICAGRRRHCHRMGGSG